MTNLKTTLILLNSLAYFFLAISQKWLLLYKSGTKCLQVSLKIYVHNSTANVLKEKMSKLSAIGYLFKKYGCAKNKYVFWVEQYWTKIHDFQGKLCTWAKIYKISSRWNEIKRIEHHQAAASHFCWIFTMQLTYAKINF